MKGTRLINNTISARREKVVSRKWYREGYFSEGWKGLLRIQFAEAGDSLRAAVYIQLTVDVLEMHLDGASRKKQFPGNRIIGETLSDQMQHFKFADGERFHESKLMNARIGFPLCRWSFRHVIGKCAEQFLGISQQA